MPAPTDSLIAWATDTLYATGARINQATKTALTLAAAAQGFFPGVGFPVDVLNEILNTNYQWLAFLREENGTGKYGDGSDGDVVVTGGTTTLSEDLYADDLDVEASGILDANGFRIFVRGTMTVDVGGLVHNDGVDGVDSGAGGSAGSNGSLGTAAVGGSGVSDDAGDPGAASTNSAGGAGGAGGASATRAGGAGGGATAPAGSAGGFRHAAAMLGYVVGIAGVTVLTGGGGGGAGGGDTSGAGAGGGGGGGGLSIHARVFVNNGTIRAGGGAGGDGVLGAGDDPAGGGGGGGGFVFVETREQSGSGTITAPGGLGGVGGDSADDGDPGDDGTVILLVG